MKCKDCARYKDEWCEKIADSPDEEMERECEHFVQRKGGGRSVTVTRAQAETMRREWHVGMADSFGTLTLQRVRERNEFRKRKEMDGR